MAVIIPMWRPAEVSAADRAFTIGAIALMAAPMALLTWFAVAEGDGARGIAYLYLPWYVPLALAGTTVYALALIGVILVPRPDPRSLSRSQ